MEMNVAYNVSVIVNGAKVENLCPDDPIKCQVQVWETPSVPADLGIWSLGMIVPCFVYQYTKRQVYI